MWLLDVGRMGQKRDGPDGFSALHRWSRTALPPPGRPWRASGKASPHGGLQRSAGLYYAVSAVRASSLRSSSHHCGTPGSRSVATESTRFPTDKKSLKSQWGQCPCGMSFPTTPSAARALLCLSGL